MSINGSIKAIISPDSTDTQTKVVLPISTASSIYFGDGQTLQAKYDNGDLGGSSATSIVIPNKWQGKKIYCFGDSITAGGYPIIIGELLGAYVTNKGSSGGTYNRDYDIITATDLTGVDAITIMTGHNGGAGSTTLESSGLLDVADTTDYSSFPNNYYGGIGKIIEYVRHTYPDIKIYLLGLHYTLRGTTSKDCQRALKEIGNYYSVPFIDVYANCGIGATNIGVYSSDGTHMDLLDGKGNKLLANCIAYQMMYL